MCCSRHSSGFTQKSTDSLAPPGWDSSPWFQTSVLGWDAPSTPCQSFTISEASGNLTAGFGAGESCAGTGVCVWCPSYLQSQWCSFVFWRRSCCGSRMNKQISLSQRSQEGVWGLTDCSHWQGLNPDRIQAQDSREHPPGLSHVPPHFKIISMQTVQHRSVKRQLSHPDWGTPCAPWDSLSQRWQTVTLSLQQKQKNYILSEFLQFKTRVKPRIKYSPFVLVGSTQLQLSLWHW